MDDYTYQSLPPKGLSGLTFDHLIAIAVGVLFVAYLIGASG